MRVPTVFVGLITLPLLSLLPLTVTLSGSQVTSVTSQGVTLAAGSLVHGSSNANATLFGSGSAADDLDLSTYFAKNFDDPHWDVDLGAWSDPNGAAPDFFIFEAGGNDVVQVAAWLADGSFGTAVPLGGWSTTGYVLSAGPNAGQTVYGAAVSRSDLRDGSGNPLPAATILRGLRIVSDTIDGCAFAAADSGLAPNQAPVARAGDDRFLFDPAASLSLDATASTDAEDPPGQLVFQWTQVAGPTTLTLAGANGPQPLVSGFVVGSFELEVTVTDTGGLSDSDRVRIEVLPAGQSGGTVNGVLETWHRITLDFTGPATSESAVPNPFRDLRLDVILQKGSRAITVPGYFAADGNAGTSHAAAGSTWRVAFAPDEAGTWTYYASFRQGPDVAADASFLAGTALPVFSGVTGSFTVAPSTAQGRDFRRHGRLEYVGRHHLRFAESGEWFLKGGADSPENFLAFSGFDQTPPTHVYAPHVADWNPGDPDWLDETGNDARGIIGAINYLAGKGMNSIYFLTMNVTGDGNDVWPWTSPTTRDRFDCSKLDQWVRVVDHMTSKGVLSHVITQETENDQLLNGGGLGVERRIYYRELVARLGHSPALVWNLGEENTNTNAQRQAFASFIRALDPYDHPIVVHTYPGQYQSVYGPLLGFGDFEGPSLQLGNAAGTHGQTVSWWQQSEAAGRPWFVSLDEIGPATQGVLPDANDFWHDAVRQQALWGNLMGGGAGCEWYFGYAYPNDDLDCEDWRSRDHMWDLTRYALEFFQRYLPFQDMVPSDGLVGPGAWCLRSANAISAVYLPAGGSTSLDLGSTTEAFEVAWYDPRHGGPLTFGSTATVSGPGSVSLGQPPQDPAEDWAVLVRPLSSFVEELGPGTIGSAGIPVLNVSASPLLGNAAFQLEVESALPASTVLLALSLDRVDPPIPFAGGSVYLLPPVNASPWSQVGTTSASGAASFALPLPLLPELEGLDLHAQAVVEDPAAVLGYALTRGLRLRLH